MTEQNKSLSDLERDIAKSRERLAATIDELAFRAQPKNIVAEQKRQLKSTLMDRYHSFMGTTPASTTERTTRFTDASSSGSKVEQAKAKAEDLKTTAAVKADELKVTATSKIHEFKARTQSQGQHAEPGSASPLADIKTRAQVKADQARLKMDEATHDSDGELRMDRIVTGLAATGAALISLGVAKRNKG